MTTVTLLLSMILTAASPLIACKEPKAIEKKKTVILTEEEKEILQGVDIIREVLK